MATLVGTQKNIESLLNALVELEFDAVEAYRVAVPRLARVEFREQFNEFKADHERHVRELSALMHQAGWAAPDHADLKQYVTKGKVLLGDLVGGDRAILAAMSANEDDTNRAYGRAQERLDLPGELRTQLDANLTDERRHRAWIEQRLTIMEEEEETFAREDDERFSEPDARL